LALEVNIPGLEGSVHVSGFAEEVTLQRIAGNIELLAQATGKTVSTKGVTALNQASSQSAKSVSKVGKESMWMAGGLATATVGIGALSRATQGVAHTFKSAMKGIEGSSSDLGSGVQAAAGILKSASDLTGKAFAGFFGAAGKLGQFTGRLGQAFLGLSGGAVAALVGVIAQAATDYGKLQQAGGLFGGSLGQMRDTAVNAGLTLTQFSNVFRKNTKLFAAFGGATSEGSRQFGKMNKEIKNLYAGNFLRLGIGFEEITARNAESVEQFARAGINVMEMANGTELVAKRTRELAMQQKMLAAFNGTTLEQEREKHKAAKMDVLLQSVLAGESEGVRTAMEQLNTATKEMHPGLARLAAQYFKFGGAADAAGLALESQLGSVAGPMKEYVLGLKNQTKTGANLQEFLGQIDPGRLKQDRKAAADIAAISLGTSASLGVFGEVAEKATIPLLALSTKLNMGVLDKIEADMKKFGETPDMMTKAFMQVTTDFQDAAVRTQEAMNNILFGVRDDFLGTVVSEGAGFAVKVSGAAKDLAGWFRNLTETVKQTNTSLGGIHTAPAGAPPKTQQWGGPFDAGEALMFETGKPEAITFNKPGKVTPTANLFKSIMPDMQKMMEEFQQSFQPPSAGTNRQAEIAAFGQPVTEAAAMAEFGNDVARKREVEDAMLALPGLLMENTDAINKSNVENVDSLQTLMYATS
jgi:hypothetical protein